MGVQEARLRLATQAWELLAWQRGLKPEIPEAESEDRRNNTFHPGQP